MIYNTNIYIYILHQLKLYIEGCLCALRAQGSVTYIFFIHILILDRSCQHLGIYILDISCQLLGDMCQLEGFCPRAQLSGAQLSTLKKWTVGPRGPTVRGPTVQGPNCPGPNCPGAQLSGAQLSGGPTVRGPTVRGPTVRGPTVRGPIRLEPFRSLIIWLSFFSSLFLSCLHVLQSL